VRKWGEDDKEKSDAKFLTKKERKKERKNERKK
jgi:hypothetical protein